MNKLLKIALIISSTLFLSNANSKTYEIEKDKHGAAGMQIGIFSGDEIKFAAKFNSSAIYDLGNDNQDDVNKLFGFSDCYSAHHSNSARFGWRWNLESSKFCETFLKLHNYRKSTLDIVNQFDSIKPEYYSDINFILNESIKYIVWSNDWRKESSIQYISVE